jgi:hypothetical protein
MRISFFWSVTPTENVRALTFRAKAQNIKISLGGLQPDAFQSKVEWDISHLEAGSTGSVLPYYHAKQETSMTQPPIRFAARPSRWRKTSLLAVLVAMPVLLIAAPSGAQDGPGADAENYISMLICTGAAADEYHKAGNVSDVSTNGTV